MNMIQFLKNRWSKICGAEQAQPQPRNPYWYLEPNLAIFKSAAKEVKRAPLPAPEFRLDDYRATINESFRVQLQQQPLTAGTYGAVVVARGKITTIQGRTPGAKEEEVVVKISAAKFLSPAALEAWEITERRKIYFHLELDHPHFVRYYQSLWLTSPTTGARIAHAIETELLDTSLATLFRRRRFTYPQAGRLNRQLASALVFMADRRIVHGDITPANVCVEGLPNADDDRRVYDDLGSVTYKLINYGKMKRYDEDRFGGCVEKSFSGGAERYICPEKASLLTLKKGYDPYKAEVFALGAISFEAVAGRGFMEQLTDTDTLTGWDRFKSEELSNRRIGRYENVAGYTHIIDRMLEPEVTRLHAAQVLEEFEKLEDQKKSNSQKNNNN